MRSLVLVRFTTRDRSLPSCPLPLLRHVPPSPSPQPAAVTLESGSQKVQHHFGGFKHKSETISITKMVNSENSSDLERVAATRSIAVEFSEFTILVIELQRCENTAFHFHAAPFGIRTPRCTGGLQADARVLRVRCASVDPLHAHGCGVFGGVRCALPCDIVDVAVGLASVSCMML